MASNSKMCYDVGMRCGHPSAHTYGLLLEKEFFMETYNDQLFPPAFLVNYTKEPAGRQRVLTYSLFRFLSCVSEEHPDLAQFLADQVSCPSAEDSFEILEVISLQTTISRLPSQRTALNRFICMPPLC